MSLLVFTDCFVSINSVDLSDHVKSVKLTYNAAMQNNTAMGVGTKTSLAGLKEWTAEVEFFQDYAASNVDATLFALIGAAAFAIEIRPVKTGGRSATNPGYTGNAVLANYQPVGGAVGDLAMTGASFQSAGALSRQIA
jgi:hypothetical protein